ncbi:fatty acid desaturase [Pseudaminobacter sp. 19-2017]|uniref:Fatty acid desaturase n=1 Tax=Pseudaminobacter soli (ex Zhang et al. 2022) TaxID=2831468 RepID=A0A942DXF4_9HYPH|nr:fatty acid desaturase [Pseudaminobacter soli]MBS3649574.1 fatty acid desaturase [Pseudaminobacter soli]
MTSKSTRSVGRRQSVEWPTFFLIVATYAAWALLGAAGWDHYPITTTILLAFVLALQSSLIHEVLHGHPTRKAWVNELLIGLPIGLVYPYRRFKALHLRHHADDSLTDPFDDPESYYQALWRHEELPDFLKLVLTVNNTMVGRIILGPLLGSAGFLASEVKLMADGDKAVRRAWLHHAVGMVIMLAIAFSFFTIPVWAYLTAVWLGQSLISVRTYAEHQWSERPDGRTIIVERSPLAFFFLNNNLHLVHHKSPTTPWYELPALFRERREEWVAMNRGYVFPNYLALLKSFAFKAKEPVVHPALRRAPEAGRAFRPRVLRRSLNGLGSAPVPAEPPKD